MIKTYDLASRWRRIIATFIDIILVPSLTLFFVLILGVIEDPEDFTDRWWIVHILLLAIFSYLLLNGFLLRKFGQTIGKAIMHISIVKSEPHNNGLYYLNLLPIWKILFIRAMFFPLLYMIVIPWFMFVPIIDQILIFGKNRRCLHDYLAGSVVVYLSK